MGPLSCTAQGRCTQVRMDHWYTRIQPVNCVLRLLLYNERGNEWLRTVLAGLLPAVPRLPAVITGL